MDDPIQIVLLYGGDTCTRYDKTLRKNVRRFEHKAKQCGAKTTFVELGRQPFRMINAKPSKYIYPPLRPLANVVRPADIVMICSPVHWRYPSLLTLACVFQVLAPLEWGGLKGGGFENWGKIGSTMIVCDDDGASLVAATLKDALDHMGLHIPAWSSHHRNIAMPPGSSEDGWQDEPEALAPILIETAKRMRGFPSIPELLAQAR